MCENSYNITAYISLESGPVMWLADNGLETVTGSSYFNDFIDKKTATFNLHTKNI